LNVEVTFTRADRRYKLERWRKAIRCGHTAFWPVVRLRYSLEAGVPLDLIAPLLGHSNTVMTKNYAHFSDKALRAATEKAAGLLEVR
jgi:integrase